jgi:hypothetical protein
MSHPAKHQVNRAPWNNRRRIGPKPPLKLREIWAIRIRLQLAKRTRDLALFNLAIDSKLRGCDLVRLRVGTLPTAGVLLPVQLWSSEKPNSRYGSNSASRLATRRKPGSHRHAWVRASTCFRAA